MATPTTTGGLITIATAAGKLTCKDSIVLLTGTSTGSHLNYSWTGPAGFTSQLPNPSVTTAGIYTLTATDSTNGNTGTDTATVLEDRNPPISIDLYIVSGQTPINCHSPYVGLGETTTVIAPDSFGMIYVWRDPNHIPVDSGNVGIIARVPGIYTFTATQKKNGCSLTNSINIPGDITVPVISIQRSVPQINCINPSSTLTASTTTPNSSYLWGALGTSPSTAGSSFTVTTANTYVVQVTDTVSFCTSTASIQVSSNITPPTNVTATTLFGFNELTCAVPTHTLNASSSSGATYTWTGPNNFNASGAQAGASLPGTYTLLATNPANGCTATAQISLVMDTVHPSIAFVTTPNTRVLSCFNNLTITLDATTSAATSLYNWSGPRSSSQKTLSVQTAGVYNLQITDLNNGCKTNDTISFTANKITPVGLAVAVDRPISCLNASANLAASAATTVATYQWMGPGGFTANTASINTTIPGDYILIGSDPSSGCFSIARATVVQDISQPSSVTANPSSILTCAQTSINLTGNSTTAGASYLWTGPGGFNSTSRVTSTTAPGAYLLTVTHPASGCKATKSVNVQQNITPPANVSIAPPDQLNCDVTSVELTGSSTTSNVLYIWSGPNDFSDVVPTTTVSEPGEYVLTVTDLSNSCSSTASVTVDQDLTACEAMAQKLASGQAATLIAADPGRTQPATGFKYSIYPNPLSNASSVHFTAPKNAHVQIVIYSVTGVREKVLFDGRAEAHQAYQFPVGASRMAPGIHFCLIRMDNRIYSNKLIL